MCSKHARHPRANPNIHSLPRKLATRATWLTLTPVQTQFCSWDRSTISSKGKTASPVCAKRAAF
jgi:hypothetical protein